MAAPRDRELGAELRALRERAGLSLVAVAGIIQWNISTLSRLERGQRHISPETVMGLAVVYELPVRERLDLLSRAKEPSALGWWDHPRPGVPYELATLACYEHHAIQTTDWSPGVIPALLQTPGYAAAVLRDRGVPEVDLNPRLRVLRQRQESLDRRYLDYTAFVGVSALHNELCSPEDFLAQLQLVRELSDRDGVTVRLVNDGTALAAGGWYLMNFPTAGPIVLVEDLSSGTFLFDRDTAPYTKARTVLDGIALSVRATQNMLDTLIKQHTDPDVLLDCAEGPGSP